MYSCGFLYLSMINFFKKIRKKLLSKNKFSSYIIYAVGEIILVVVGILIALQINNWNESRKQRLHKIELVKLLITDLEDRKAENIADRNSGLSMVDVFRKSLKYWEDNNDIDTTNLKIVLGLLASDDWYYHNQTPTYNRLSNSALWENIPDSLAMQVNDIYYSRFTAIKTEFENSREYATTCKINYLRPSGLINLNQSAINLKSKIIKNPKNFISYVQLSLANVKSLNNSFLRSENSIKEVVQKLHVYKNSL